MIHREHIQPTIFLDSADVLLHNHPVFEEKRRKEAFIRTVTRSFAPLMTTKPSVASVPRHVAIIMDGNGRWAKQHGLTRNQGHREGVESVRAVVRACKKAGVKYLTLYAFSTENWVRPKSEIRTL
ncbi:undecaprenyl diphosphate synthase family protein, partial [Verrucomicrobiota bacterium]